MRTIGSALGSNDSPFPSTVTARRYSFKSPPRPAIVSCTVNRNNSRRRSAVLKTLLLRIFSRRAPMMVFSATGRDTGRWRGSGPGMVSFARTIPLALPKDNRYPAVTPPLLPHTPVKPQTCAGGSNGNENAQGEHVENPRVGLFAFGNRPRGTVRPGPERTPACGNFRFHDDAELRGSSTHRVQCS